MTMANRYDSKIYCEVQLCMNMYIYISQQISYRLKWQVAHGLRRKSSKSGIARSRDLISLPPSCMNVFWLPVDHIGV